MVTEPKWHPHGMGLRCWFSDACFVEILPDGTLTTNFRNQEEHRAALDKAIEFARGVLVAAGDDAALQERRQERRISELEKEVKELTDYRSKLLGWHSETQEALAAAGIPDGMDNAERVRLLTAERDRLRPAPKDGPVGPDDPEDVELIPGSVDGRFASCFLCGGDVGLRKTMSPFTGTMHSSQCASCGTLGPERANALFALLDHNAAVKDGV